MYNKFDSYAELINDMPDVISRTFVGYETMLALYTAIGNLANEFETLQEDKNFARFNMTSMAQKLRDFNGDCRTFMERFNGNIEVFRTVVSEMQKVVL